MLRSGGCPACGSLTLKGAAMSWWWWLSIGGCVSALVAWWWSVLREVSRSIQAVAEQDSAGH
jgi:hypothetical protein